MSVLTNVGYDIFQPYNYAGKLSVIDFVIALFLIIWRTRLIASLQSDPARGDYSLAGR